MFRIQLQHVSLSAAFMYEIIINMQASKQSKQKKNTRTERMKW